MDGDSHWLTMMTRKPRKVIHPLKHLLFIRFLYGSLENFINGYSLQEYLPFGRGPWPCLNKAANHYMKPVVHDCFITPCSKARLPVGTFICNCGFVYARRGPDHSEEDRYKVGRIKSFGGVWLKRLNELIHIEKTSYRYAAKILGVNTKTVIKYINLQTPAESYEIKHKQKVRNESKLIKKTVSQKTRRNKTHHSQRVDWELRDLELSIRIEILCQELLSSKEKPVRITMTGIARRLGHLSLLLRNRRKLPVCMAILDKYRESIEEFQIRRVRWAVSQLEGYWSIKRWRIEKLAGLKPGYSETVRWEIEKYVTSTNFGVLRDNEVNNNWLH